jgi:hypothetical protein
VELPHRGLSGLREWPKDRKGRALSAEDVTHYHRIVVALHETIRLMKEIDEVIEAHGGGQGRSRRSRRLRNHSHAGCREKWRREGKAGGCD